MPVRVFLLTDTVFLLSLFPKDRKWAKNEENFLVLGFDSSFGERGVFDKAFMIVYCF